MALDAEFAAVEAQLRSLDPQKKGLETKIGREKQLRSDLDKASGKIAHYEGLGLTAWKETRKRGSSHKWYAKNGDVSYVGSTWNDRMKSIYVDKGCNADLYKDSGYRSSKYEHGPGSFWDGNASVSSFKISYTSDVSRDLKSAKSSKSRLEDSLAEVTRNKTTLEDVKRSIANFQEKKAELQRYKEGGDYDLGKESLLLSIQAGRDTADVLLAGFPVFRSGGGSYGTQSKDGVNVAVIDRATGKMERTAIFEKSKGSAAADEMLKLVEALPEKRIVVVACRGDVDDLFKIESLRRSLHLIGATKFPQEEDDEGQQTTFSYAAIGFKGAKVGMAIEHIAENAPVEERFVFSPVHSQELISKFVPSQGLMVAGSACKNAGDFAYVRVRGSAVIGDGAETEASPGINAVALESSDGAIISKEVFRTQEQVSESVRLARWILELPVGAYFALAARGEAAKAMNRICTNHVCSFGSADAAKLQGSYSVIGYIDGHGAPRALSERSSAMKSVEARKTFVDEENVWKGDEEEDLARNEIDIVARSGPWEAELEDSASITLNGRVIVGPAACGAPVRSRRGLNVVAIDPLTGEIIKVGNYDTVRSDDAGFWFSKWVKSLPRDTMVAIATGGDVKKKMSESGKSSILSLGAQSFGKLQKGYGFAMVGRVGAAVGSIPEDDDNVYGAEARVLLRLEATRSATNQAFGGYLKLSARSGGLLSGDHAYISMDDEIIVAPDMDDPEVVMDDGLNIAAFDPKTGDLLEADNFNINLSPEAAGERMRQFLESLPDGVLVAVAAMGETKFSYLSDAQKAALASVGAREIVKVGDNGSYASIGRKGEDESADLPDSFSNRSSVACTHLIEPRIQKPLSNDVFLTVEAAGDATGAKYAQIKVNGKVVAGGVIAEGEEDAEKQEMLRAKLAAEQGANVNDTIGGAGIKEEEEDVTLDEPEGMREEDEVDKIAYEEEPEATMNIVALSSDTGNVIGKLEFKSDERMMGMYIRQFTAFFEQLIHGTFICLACRGSAIQILPAEARAMLRSIGATLYENVTAESSYCVIGQKGARPASALEDLEQDLFTDENGVTPPAKLIHSFTPRMVPYSLTVQAAPMDEGERNVKGAAIITLDHMKALSTAEGAVCTAGKGMNVAVIGSYGALRRSDCFNINQTGEAGEDEQKRMASMIRNAAEDEILAFAMVGNLTVPSVSPRLLTAMKSLGLELFENLLGGAANEKEAYSAIGVRSDPDKSSERITREGGQYALSSYQWPPPEPERWDEGGADEKGEGGGKEQPPDISASALMTVFHRLDTEDENRFTQNRCYRATLSADMGETFTLEITADEQCTALINRKWYPLGPQRPAIVDSNEGSKVNLMIELEEDDMDGPELFFRHFGSRESPMVVSLSGAAGTERFVKNLDMQRLSDATDPVSGKKVVAPGTTADQLTAAGRAVKALSSSSDADRASKPMDSSTTKPARMLQPKGSFLVGLDGAKEAGGFVKADMLPENLGIGTVRNATTKQMEVTMYSRTTIDTVETAARSHRTDLIRSRGFFSKLKKGIKRGFKKAKNFVSKSFKKVGKSLKKGWNTVKNVAVVAGKVIAKGAKKLYEAAKMVVEVVVDGATKAFEVIMDKVIGPAVRGLWNAVTFVMDSIGSAMGTVMGWAMEALGGLIGLAPSDILEKRDIIVKETTQGFPAVIAVAQKELEDMYKATSNGVDKLREALGSEPSEQDRKQGMDEEQMKEPQQKKMYVDEKSGQESDIESNENWMMDKFMDGIQKVLGAKPPDLTHTANAIFNMFMGAVEDMGGLISAVVEAFGKIISQLVNPKKLSFALIKKALAPISESFVDLIDNKVDDLLGPNGLFQAMLKDAQALVSWFEKVRPNIPGFTAFYKAFFSLKEAPTFMEILMTLPAVAWCIVEAGKTFIGKLFGRGLNAATVSGSRELSFSVNEAEKGTARGVEVLERTVVPRNALTEKEASVGFIVFGILRLCRTALRLFFTELVAAPLGEDDDGVWELKHAFSVIILGLAWGCDLLTWRFNQRIASSIASNEWKPAGVLMQQSFGTGLVMFAVYLGDQRFKAGKTNALQVRKNMIAFASIIGLLRVNLYFWLLTENKTAKLWIGYIISCWLNLAIFAQQATPAAVLQKLKIPKVALKRQRQLAEVGFGVASSIIMFSNTNSLDDALDEEGVI